MFGARLKQRRQAAVDESPAGIVIGLKGSKIKLVKEKTGARIDTSSDGFTITGEPRGVAQAEAAVKDSGPRPQSLARKRKPEPPRTDHQQFPSCTTLRHVASLCTVQ
eukprot:10781876-Alexandrium_andersonii.AAC.1